MESTACKGEVSTWYTFTLLYTVQLADDDHKKSAETCCSEHKEYTVLLLVVLVWIYKYFLKHKSIMMPKL
jgi:hypothetical protein